MSLLKTKFDYEKISRVSINNVRYYETPTKDCVPSVTSVLDKTKSEEKRLALENWRRRVGHKQATEITSDAANRGTRLHNYLEDYVTKGFLKDKTNNPYSWASHAMAEVIIKKGIANVNEVWGVEVPLYFPGIYAGTTDSVGVHNGDPAIMDYKQSNSRKKEEWIDDYKLQLAAYATAHNEVYETNIRKGVIMMAVKPEVDKQNNVISEPEYQEFVVEGSDFDYWQQQWWQRLEKFYEQVSSHTLDTQLN
jgi:genome maintenance exonuclease 1